MIDLETLPNAQRRALELVREVAAEKDCSPYLVGGPVRDLLLGREAIDVDLTLEDGASALARGLAKRVEGRVHSFPQFLTYKVTAVGLPDIDIATARKERYRKPGALPTVTAGRLKDDLLRRDFSINAIAFDILTGELHDPTGGEQDLDAGQVRVLHDASFLDDPTRIFRAVRLAVRLGFRLEPQTEELMRSAIAGGAMETVSKERLWRELFLAMDEAEAPGVLAAIATSGACAPLFGRPAPTSILERCLDVAQTQSLGSPDLDRHVLYTAALLHGNASPVDLEGSGFSQKRARNIVQIANELPRFTDALAEATSERERLRLLKVASPEMLSVLAATVPEEQPAVARFQEFRNFRISVRGNDLEVPLGPHVARALERAREAVFTGEIPADQARTFAREMAIKYLHREQTAETKG
jgi:tRNA nucleotidyltransferase/poly(A) polymerase